MKNMFSSWRNLIFKKLKFEKSKNLKNTKNQHFRKNIRKSKILKNLIFPQNQKYLNLEKCDFPLRIKKIRKSKILNNLIFPPKSKISICFDFSIFWKFENFQNLKIKFLQCETIFFIRIFFIDLVYASPIP